MFIPNFKNVLCALIFSFSTACKLILSSQALNFQVPGYFPSSYSV
jgi:hypothetical protein